MKKIKRTSKKLMSVLLSVLMLAVLSVTFAFAAEECEHSSYDHYVVTEEGTYDICKDCGEIIYVYCEHAEYEFDYGEAYNIYCNGGERCGCGSTVIRGTKHQLGEFIKVENNPYFVCSLCEYKIYVYDAEYTGTYIHADGDGTYSGEWITYDYDTGTVSGFGKLDFDRNGVLTVSGKGVCDLYRILRCDEKYVRCDICGDGHYPCLGTKVQKLVIGEGITYLKDFNSIFAEEVVFPESLGGSRYEILAPDAVMNIPDGFVFEDYVVAKEYVIDKNSTRYALDKEGSLYSKDMTVLYRYVGKDKVVTIPDTVKEIYTGAFIGNSHIERVNIPSSVKVIGEEAFMACKNLKSVSLSYGLEKIDENAFSLCVNLEEIVLPDSVTEVGEDAFSMCFSLKYVQLSKGMKVISGETFNECMNLKNINIPSNIEKIEAFAFENCPELVEINIYSDAIDLSDSRLGMIGVEIDTAAKEKYIECIKEAITAEVDAVFNIKEYDETLYDSYYSYVECNVRKIVNKLDDFRDSITYHDPAIPSDKLVIYCNEGSSAEAYAVEKGLQYVANACEHKYGEWITDEAKGIKYKTCVICGKVIEEDLDFSGGDIYVDGSEGDNKFTVEYIDNPKSPEYLYVRNTLEGNILAVYDINLLDENGNKVQPDGKVKVSLPLSEDVEYFVVLRINDDGSYTDMNAVREGNSAVFETDHFSYYVILGGEKEADTGDNIKCECLCHKTPLLEIIMRIFKMLAKFLGTEITFPCDC